MLRMPEFRQLLIGISTRRYLPPSGTAGLALSFVNGKSLVPAPPPIMMAKVLSTGRIEGTSLIGSPSLVGFSQIVTIQSLGIALAGPVQRLKSGCLGFRNPE